MKHFAVVACVLAAGATYFHPWFGLGVLAIATTFVVIPSLAAIVGAEPLHADGLTAEATSVMDTYSHYFRSPAASRDFAAASRIISVTSLLLGAFTVRGGDTEAFALAAVLVLVTGVLAGRLTPQRWFGRNAHTALHDEILQWMERDTFEDEAQTATDAKLPAGHDVLSPG